MTVEATTTQRHGRHGGGPWRHKTNLALPAFLAAVFLLLTQATALAEPRVVKVGVYENIPLIFTNEKGRASGLSIEVLREIAKFERWDLQFVSCEWSDCLAMLGDGRIDLQAAIIANAERDKVYDFTKSFVFNLWGQVYTTPSRSFETLLDLDGKRVGLYEGSVPARTFLELTHSFGVRVEPVMRANYHDLADLVRTGEVDAAVFVRSFAEYYTDRYALSRTPIIFAPLPLRYGTLKGTNGDLILTIDHYLKRWKSKPNSPYYAVLESVFGEQALETRTPPYVYGMFLALAALTAVAFLFNQLLRRQVLTKTKQLQEEVDVKDEFARQLIVNSERLRNREADYKGLFEGSEVSIWNEDLSEVYQELKQLRIDGVTDICSYFSENEHLAWALASKVKVLEVNPATLKLFEVNTEADLLAMIDKTFGDGAIQVFIDELCAIWEKRPFFRAEANFRTVKGRDIQALISFRMPQSEEGFQSVPISIIDITDRKRAERLLQKSESRFRSIFEQAAVGVAVINSQTGHFVQVNQRYCDIVGYSPEEMTGTTFQDITYGEDLQQDLDYMAQLRAGDIAEFSMEKRYTHKNGGLVWVNLTVSPTWAQGATPDYHIAVVEDITQRKLAEQNLRNSERRLSTLMGNLPGMAYRCYHDRLYTMVFVSEGCEELTGYRPAELLMNRDIAYLEVIVEEDRDYVANTVLQSVADHVPFELVYRINHKTHGVRWVWEKGGLAPETEEGQFLEGFIADITKRKQAEQALRRTQQIVEQSPVTVLVTELDGTITYVNPAFTRITGYTPEEVLGLTPRVVKSGENPPEQYERLWATLGAGRTWTGELCNKCKDGSYYWASTVISPLIENGECVGYIGVAEDVTERKRTEGQLRHAQKMEAVGQLTGGIAHDFNNMLGVVMGNLELLRRKLTEDGKAREYVDAAYKATERGADITKKLLAFSRQEAAVTPAVNVNDLINDMTNLIAKSLTASVDVETHLEDDVWPVSIDPGDFENTLLNLALNARDAMPGGGRLVIETQNKWLDELYVARNPDSALGAHVMVSVSDTGFGLNPELIDQVFHPFFSTKEEGKGTGLGLSMVYGFVKRSGGHIKIYSERDQGTTFRLFLPKADAGNAKEPERAPVVHEVLARGTETVLAVDDEEALLNIAVTLLEDLGYTTLSAKSADDALTVIGDNPNIDLLFTDVVMPGSMDGFDLALKAHAINPNMKVLLVSGFTAKISRTSAPEDSFAARLSQVLLDKPYNQYELAAAVRNALDDDS